MKPTLIISLILFCLSTKAQSDDNFKVASISNDGTIYYAYVEKTNYDNSKNTWIKYTDPIKKIKNKKGKIVETGGQRTLMFLKIDCENHEYDLHEVVIYNKQGEVDKHFDANDFNKKIIPGSIISNIYDFVCVE